MTNRIVAYCGLICSDCSAYIATQSGGRSALERVAAQYERLYREVSAAPPPSFPPAWMKYGGRLWGALAAGLHLVRGLRGRIT